MWGWKGREGQRRREDKLVVICLFNWLKCWEESCVVILALGLDRVQAPGFGSAQWGAVERGPGLPFTREGPLGEDGSGDRVGGSNTWLEAAFTSPAFQKFKTVIQGLK